MALFKGRKRADTDNARSARRPVAGQRSNVFSYYAQSKSASEERRPVSDDARRLRPTETVALGKKRKGRLQYLPVLLTLLVLVICSIYNIYLQPNPQVLTHSVTEENPVVLRDKSVYQAAVADALGESWLSRSKLTIDTQAIAESLTEQFPELSDVTVTLPLLGTRPVVHLEATQPAAILISSDTAYVIDSRGIVLMDAKELKTDTNLPMIRDESGVTIEKGKAALSADQVSFIQELYHQFSEKKLTVTEVRLPAAAQQLDVYFKEVKYKGIFLFGTESRVAAGSFTSLREYLAARSQSPQSYIDVRIEGRAYYR